MLGAIKEEGKYYIITNVKDNFVQLTIPTAKFCLEQLNEFNMKIYCYLLNKQQIHDKYHYKENYFFSKKELLEAVGYSRGQKNIYKLESALYILEQFGLIEYNHEMCGRPGKHGLYMELYKVNQYSKAQIEIAKNFIKESKVITDAEVAEQVCIPGVDLEKVELAGDAKVWLEIGAHTLDSLPKKYLDAYNEMYGKE